MGRTIWVARHALRVDYGIEDTWRDPRGYHDDPGLSQAGFEQVRALAARLIGQGIEHIVSSPFLRAIQTAEIVAEALGLCVNIEAGMGEWHSAHFFPEGAPAVVPISEKIERFKNLDFARASGIAPIYPETFDEMQKRVARAVERVLVNFEGDLLLIGHGASVDAAVKCLANPEIPLDSDLCCVYKLTRRRGRYIIEIDNDTSHLQGLAPQSALGDSEATGE